MKHPGLLPAVGVVILVIIIGVVIARYDTYVYEYNIGDIVYLPYIDGMVIIVDRARYLDGRYRVRFRLPYGMVQTIIVQHCEISKERPKETKK